MNKVPQRILTALLVPVCLMCAGCDGADTEDGDIRSEAGMEHSVADCAYYNGDDVGECELKLHDGRRVTCAILISSSKQGGLSCDWANAAKTNGKTE